MVDPRQGAPLGDWVTAQFAADGVVCVRGLLGPEWIEQLRAGVDEAVRHPGPNAKTREGSRYFVENGLWRREDGFRRLLFESPLAAAAAKVMGSRQARLYNDAMFVKGPGTQDPTPWHQDLPYFLADGPYSCSAWIGLDPADRDSGAMSYAVGSHRWGKVFSPIDFADAAQSLNGDDEFDGLPPDIDARPDLYEALCFDLEPGDVVFHHLLTLHKAGANNSRERSRRVYTVRFVGDRAVWKTRRFSTFEFEGDLRDGDPLEGQAFPVLA
jgi:ectoine hydroxylase-related dioxygenase (phytanoyl-CoA dioxygenase family)